MNANITWTTSADDGSRRAVIGNFEFMAKPSQFTRSIWYVFRKSGGEFRLVKTGMQKDLDSIVLSELEVLIR